MNPPFVKNVFNTSGTFLNFAKLRASSLDRKISINRRNRRRRIIVFSVKLLVYDENGEIRCGCVWKM